jgi:hypothetical protein
MILYGNNGHVYGKVGTSIRFGVSNVVQYPYLTFEFSVASFTPTTLSLLNSHYTSKCEWKQVSSSPNVWNLEIHDWYIDEKFSQASLYIIFSPSDSGTVVGYLNPNKLGGGTCKLIGSGNFDVPLNGYYCQSFDRMFRNCTGLTSIVPIQCSYVENVGGMFEGCTNIEGGALDQYNWFATYGVNISNHSGTFTSCGSSTQTGLAELDQIPVGWGGNLVPASTLMTSTLKTDTSWRINDPGTGFPGFDKVKDGMYLFTQASVSKYAGVSMNRGRINNKLNGLKTSQGSYALYFYPAFVQCPSLPGTASNNVSWLVTTDIPNGSLAVSQGNTDMPGTLDYSTYGPFTREYGTYDSIKDVYFVFLVTNVPIAQWGGLTDAMGFLYNSNYKTDAGLRWFF